MTTGWDGSGNFTRGDGTREGPTTWAKAKTAAQLIDAPAHDTHDEILADGIEACLAKNGENTMTGTLNLGGNNISNVNVINSDFFTCNDTITTTNFAATESSTFTGDAITDVPVTISQQAGGTGDILVINTESGEAHSVDSGGTWQAVAITVANATALNTVTVSGASTLTGNVTMGSAANITGVSGTLTMGGLQINGNGNVTGALSCDGALSGDFINCADKLTTDGFNFATGTPASATATGTAGDMAWDASYIYVCIATNTWKRTALTTW